MVVPRASYLLATHRTPARAQAPLPAGSHSTAPFSLPVEVCYERESLRSDDMKIELWHNVEAIDDNSEGRIEIALWHLD